MSVRLWIRNWLGEDKLQKNIENTAVIVNDTEDNKHEDETNGYTYDLINEEMRISAVTNEPISMLANAYAKGIFGANVSVQNVSADDGINESVEKTIKTFFKDGNFTLDEKNHFNYYARFMSEDLIRAGGILIKKHKIKPSVAIKRGYPLPYRVEFLELSSIDYQLSDKERKIYNGVQVNAQNKATRLHFKGGKSVSFDDLLMYSCTTRITQLNGVSSAYTSLPHMTRQEEHATAETENAIEQAKTSDIYATNIADTLKSQAQGDFDLDMASAGTTEKREISPQIPNGKNAKIIDKEKESYERLDRGSYSSVFDSINKFTNTRIAAGSRITLDEFTGDMSELTFHGGQVAQIKNDETYSAFRDDIVNILIVPMLEDMLKWCYITGYSDTEPSEDNISLNIIKKPRKSAQSGKDAIAFEKNYNNGFMTKGDVVKEISGENMDEYIKRREVEELKLIASETTILKAKVKMLALEEKLNVPRGTMEEKE